ncbi:MAG: XRE family transcriptional regulator [Clostridiales bacterium]|nr:XRE family transcriptional regulator [Clostridiales bacterium]
MIGQRIKSLRKERGLTQGALALRLGLTQQAVAKWESEQSAPDYHMLVKIAAALETRPERLFGSAGAADAGVPADGLQKALGSLEIRQAPPGEGKMIPVLGVVKAGYGLPAEEEELGREPADIGDPSRYFYLVVRGDSMEPGIRENDLALIRKQPTLDDGDLGVVVYGDGEGTLKRFHRKGDTVALQAFNPAYETLILSGDELEKLYIIGKVVETRTRW